MSSDPTPEALAVLRLPVRGPNDGVGSRTLGRVVAVFTELQEAYDYVKHHHPRFCVSGSVDGWCVYEWIKREVP